jgi:hypothetical protein
VGLLCSEFLSFIIGLSKKSKVCQPFLTKGEKSPARTRQAESDYFFGGNGFPLCSPPFGGCLLPCAAACLSAAVCRYAMRPVLAVYRCAAAGSYRGRYAAGLRPLSPEAAGVIGAAP